MPILVVSNAQLSCPSGTKPGTLMVPQPLPPGVPVADQPAATIKDFTPMNLTAGSFGQCTTHPAVAGGSPPPPCVPTCAAPWVPGSKAVMINNVPALTSDSQVMCMFTGKPVPIAITNPGQTTTQVG